MTSECNSNSDVVPLTWSATHPRAVSAESDQAAQLPMPHLMVDHDESDQFQYNVTSISPNGRLSDRRPMQVLHWHPPLKLTIAISGRTVVITADPHGDYQLMHRGHLRLPAIYRHRCGIEAGQRVLIATSTMRNILLVYPLHVIDQVLSSLHQRVMNEAQ